MINNEPLVTVYIPTHNRCELLKRAVASVLTQNYQNLELIIVDDASSDNTSAYLTELVANSENITSFRQNITKGACAARNISINVAKGKFITGLDDDDEFLPHRISDLVAHYDQNYAFICTGFFWHYGKKSRQVGYNSKKISLNDQLNCNYATNQVLVETVRLRAISGFDESFVACQDYDTWTRLIKKFGDAKKIAGASYIIHRGDDVERLTEPTNWLNGHSQFLLKHHKIMSDINLVNQEFRRIVAKRQRLKLLSLFPQLKAGLVKQKIRYFLSSNFSYLGKVRRYFLENKQT